MEPCVIFIVSVQWFINVFMLHSAQTVYSYSLSEPVTKSETTVPPDYHPRFQTIAPSASKHHWPTLACCPSELRVVSLFASSVLWPPCLSAVLRCTAILWPVDLATTHIAVWCSTEDLATVLYSSARVGSLHVTGETWDHEIPKELHMLVLWMTCNRLQSSVMYELSPHIEGTSWWLRA
jgi:hypothetical protein